MNAKTKRVLLAALLVAMVGGCGESKLKQEFAPEDSGGGEMPPVGGGENLSGVGTDAPPPASSRVIQTTPRISTGVLQRSSLLPVIDQGLGRFLQGVRLDAVKHDGRFVGFRILSLYPDDVRFQQLDLGPGDVVTAVNTLSIERPGQALKAWESVRTAPALIVDYLRDGQPRRINFTIAD